MIERTSSGQVKSYARTKFGKRERFALRTFFEWCRRSNGRWNSYEEPGVHLAKVSREKGGNKGVACCSPLERPRARRSRSSRTIGHSSRSALCDTPRHTVRGEGRRQVEDTRGEGWWRVQGWAASAVLACWEPGGGTSASSQIENSTGSPQGGWFTRTRSSDWGPFTSTPRWSKVKGQGRGTEREAHAGLSMNRRWKRSRRVVSKGRNNTAITPSFLRLDRAQLMRTFAMDERDWMVFNVRKDKKEVVSNFYLTSFDEEIRALNLVTENSAIKNKVRQMRLLSEVSRILLV